MSHFKPKKNDTAQSETGKTSGGGQNLGCVYVIEIKKKNKNFVVKAGSRSKNLFFFFFLTVQMTFVM